MLAALAMVLAVAAGRATWHEDGGAVSSWLVSVLATGAVLLPAALAEELMFRGVPLVALSRAFGRIPAIVGLSLLFGLGHLSNPGVTGLAVANIAIAGVFLGLAFFTPGGLWTSTGAHLGWNLALAALAAPVSGLPLPMPWLDYLRRRAGVAHRRLLRAGRGTYRRALPSRPARWWPHDGRRRRLGMSRAAVIGAGPWATGSPTCSRSTGGRSC